MSINGSLTDAVTGGPLESVNVRLEMREPVARIDTSGTPSAPFAIALAGECAQYRVSDLLPCD